MGNLVTTYEIFRDLLVVVLTIAGLFITLGGVLTYRILVERLETKAVSAAEQKTLIEISKCLATVYRHIGYVHWVGWGSPKKDAYLIHAIKLTEIASTHADELDENVPEREEIICMIRNNLAYFYATRGKIEDVKKAREYASYIERRAPKHNKYAIDWYLTSAFVKAKHPTSDKERGEAKQILENLLQRKDITIEHKAEIEKYLGTLFERDIT